MTSENDERRPPAPHAHLTSLNGNGNTGGGDADRLLTAAELGAYLGLGAGTVLDRWQAGDLPGFKLWGRAVRFRLSEIEAWLDECHVEGRRAS